MGAAVGKASPVRPIGRTTWRAPSTRRRSGTDGAMGDPEAPEPLQQLEMPFSTTRKPVRVVAMEINHGQFEREVEVPAGYDPRRITTEWENGLLWIFLSRTAHA